MWPNALSLTGGAGGAAGASGGTANNGLSLPMSNPFDFDSSGWVVNLGSPGASTKTGGNSGANATQQTSTPTATSSGSGISSGAATGAGAGMAGGVAAMGGNMVPLLLGAVGLFLVLSHKL